MVDVGQETRTRVAESGTVVRVAVLGSRTSRTTAMANKDPPASAEEKARYDKVKDELAKMLMKKRAADRQLVCPPCRPHPSTHHEPDQAQIELSIYNLETSYLTDTASSGNIIHGFDGYLKPTQGAAARRKHDIGDGDRWFSSSSGTWSKACPLGRARPH